MPSSMFIQYSASVTHPTQSGNAAPQPFKEAITLFCTRFQPPLPQEALFWFSSAASDALEYLQGQLRILQHLDSKGVLQLYTDQIPPALRMHDEDFVRHLTGLLVGAGAACSVSVVDTRIVIGMTLPQHMEKGLGSCGDMRFDWVETFERPKAYEIEKPLKPKPVERDEIRNRGCLNQPTLSFEQRLISWTGGLV